MNCVMNGNKKIYYFNSNDSFSTFEFSKVLSKLITKQTYESQTIVFLCIGSDRATGDCLGPMIGYKLSKLQKKKFIIYGTLENPIHAKNLAETIIEIKAKYKNSFVIAIDASLGKSSHVGYITIGEGSLRPGAGVDKDLPSVGDIFITGIVNLSGLLDNMLLQTTRLNVVMTLADYIFLGIHYCIYQLEKECTPMSSTVITTPNLKTKGTRKVKELEAID
ncbi:spore protease YyaC [Anaeromicropila herbilytica]|uniref:Spore protease YyaC n=1 Tax=Anaeromicropila herbilytica TaxID=2785025 RepID=A0A7R7EGN6_9FIRM|nr:spore protease YyaC [Anaeromicropila herbilytica]BCN28855.1 spore protease YyaC [Anaeromicropila herbilytica]